MRRFLIVALVTACMVVMGAGAAFAGEITGKGKTPMVVEVTEDGHTILHGKSACAFSGLNDEFIEGDTTAPRTQSWGSLDKVTRDFLRYELGVSPGTACNPTVEFENGE